MIKDENRAFRNLISEANRIPMPFPRPERPGEETAAEGRVAEKEKEKEKDGE